jgi:hypothetical protein
MPASAAQVRASVKYLPICCGLFSSMCSAAARATATLKRGRRDITAGTSACIKSDSLGGSRACIGSETT